MAKGDEAPRPETPMDRFLRFGTALFAVPKDELPARDKPEKAKRPPKKPKPAT
jgi:hypothetical protein